MQQLKSEFEKNGGTFREYRIGDIITISSTKKKFNAVDVELGGKYPYVVRTSMNNGIKGYITENELYLNEGNTISFGQDTATMFFQENPYFTGDKIKVMRLNSQDFNEKTACYFIATMSKAFSNFSWGACSFSEEVLNEVVLSLPTTGDGKLAFDYMESYIRELEEIRIAELEEERIRYLAAYLTVSDLEDYILTQEEESAICLLQNNLVPMCEFKIGELITGQTGDVDLQQKDINGKGCYFINSGVQDFGIKGKTDKVARTFKENTITIDFWGNAYYRDFEYKLATHNHVFSYTGEAIKNKEVGLYLCATMTYFRNMFSYSNMGTMPKIADLKITLPITGDGSIDYNFMQTYIAAIQKKCIKNVVLWKDKQISATKKIVSSSTNSK